MKGKKIILGVTGSIAAYKSALLIRLLIKAGAEVKVIMTPSATKFISPLTLATLSKNEVLTGLADDAGNWSNHVALGRWADQMIIAPASCNTLAKMAAGICDNLLLAVYFSAVCPVAVAPAMDEDMWHHKTTQRNLEFLHSAGVKQLSVNNGELASGLFGMGRMAEPEEIMNWVEQSYKTPVSLAGKKVLITAGPTVEQIDPVRFISNNSTGKMGIALAEAFRDRGADVHLVLGPTGESAPEGVKTEHVRSAEEMYNACIREFSNTQIAVMSAAVADYTPVYIAGEKIKKKDEALTIELKKTKDILKSLGEIKNDGQFLAGFALETNNEVENAMAKLKNKNADIIILNSLRDKDAGFGHNTNKISIFDKNGAATNFELKSKKMVADDIADYILKRIDEKNS